MTVRVGIDLVLVDDVQRSLSIHADRYLERVYTAREVDDCRARDGVDPQRLAARFAAKEATIKVLRCGDEAVPWQTIEVVRQPGGWTALALSGRAAELAAAAHLGELAVSLTHEAAYASAVVVAECARRADNGPREVQ